MDPVNRSPLKPKEVVYSTTMLRPQRVAERLKKLMKESPDTAPKSVNSNRTMVGDPLLAMIPQRRVYPNNRMVTGTGGGAQLAGNFEVIH